MTKNPIIQSITSKLNALANKRLCSYQELLTQFLIERLVARITSEDKMVDQIVFKGGYVN